MSFNLVFGTIVVLLLCFPLLLALDDVLMRVGLARNRL